jgi:hypothetical protein
MSSRIASAFWLLAAIASLTLLSGCATQEPDNTSVRPWGAPSAGWQQNGMLGGMDYQRR